MKYSSIIERAKSRKKQIRQTSNLLERLSSKEVDELFHEADNKAFTEVNCLECANCCKTTGPLFTAKDIERISKHFKLKPSAFIDQYLRIDEDGDHVLQQTPCKFLDASNYCSIYSIRPRACAEYPHTTQDGMKGILNLTIKNSMVCPAVAKIFDIIEEQLK